MRILKSMVQLSFVATFALGLGACSKKDEGETKDGDSATLTFAMANTSSTSAALQESTEFQAPEYLGFKITSVDLYGPAAEGSDNTNDKGGAIWLDPGCEKVENQYPVKQGDSDEDDILQYPYIYSQGCGADDVDDYFELTRTTAEVNADLNSQGLPLPPGLYNRIQIRFGHPDDPADVMKTKFLAMGASAAVETLGNGHGVEVTLDTPYEIKEGSTAKVTLSYDLSTAVMKETWDSVEHIPSGEECYRDEANLASYCLKFGIQNLTPSLLEE
jgi:hypothetical protein